MLARREKQKSTHKTQFLELDLNETEVKFTLNSGELEKIKPEIKQIPEVFISMCDICDEIFSNLPRRFNPTF